MQIRGDLGEQAAPCPSGDGAVSKLVDLLRTIVYSGSLDVRAVLQVGQGPVLLARCMCALYRSTCSWAFRGDSLGDIKVSRWRKVLLC